MPQVLNRPGAYLIPYYYHKVVIPQASVRTLFTIPFPIIPINASEYPFLEMVGIEKLNGIAYSGSTSTQLNIDAIFQGGASTTAFNFNQSLVLGVTGPQKCVFRNYGGNDIGDYGAYTLPKFYQMRLSVGGSDYSAGSGDVVVESYYSAIPRTVRA